MNREQVIIKALNNLLYIHNSHNNAHDATIAVMCGYKEHLSRFLTLHNNISKKSIGVDSVEQNIKLIELAINDKDSVIYNSLFSTISLIKLDEAL